MVYLEAIKEKMSQLPADSIFRMAAEVDLKGAIREIYEQAQDNYLAVSKAIGAGTLVMIQKYLYDTEFKPYIYHEVHKNKDGKEG